MGIQAVIAALRRLSGASTTRALHISDSQSMLQKVQNKCENLSSVQKGTPYFALTTIGCEATALNLVITHGKTWSHKGASGVERKTKSIWGNERLLFGC